MPPDGPRISVIVPAFREAQNLAPLAERLFRALSDSGIEGELIIVDDDSKDGTEQVAAQLRQRYPITLIVRRSVRGLAGAVLDGFTAARGDVLVVMDADLQHPPEAVPSLVAPLLDANADFALATRYAGDAGIDAQWPWHRRLASRLASCMARPLTPLSDPMSGFFGIHRKTWKRATSLNPLGFKIALELYVKCGCTQPVEVPITFAARSQGQSKFGLKQQLAFAMHLMRLYRFRFPFAFWVCVTLLLVAVAGIGGYVLTT